MVQLVTSVESAEELDKETAELFGEMETRWREEKDESFLDIHKEIKASFVGGGEEGGEEEGDKSKDFQKCHFDSEVKPKESSNLVVEGDYANPSPDLSTDPSSTLDLVDSSSLSSSSSSSSSSSGPSGPSGPSPSLSIPSPRSSRPMSPSPSPSPSPTPSSFYSIPPSPANAPAKQQRLRNKKTGEEKEKVEGGLGGEFVQSWNKKGEAARFMLGVSKMASPKNEDTFCICSPFRHNRQVNFVIFVVMI